MDDNYDHDYEAWLELQINLINQGDFEQLDTENLLQHLRYIAREEKEKTKYLVYKIIVNLLLIDYWPEQKQSIPYWFSEIVDYQFQLFEKLSINHKIMLSLAIDEIYMFSKKAASRKSGLNIQHFPQICPYTVDKICYE